MGKAQQNPTFSKTLETKKGCRILERGILLLQLSFSFADTPDIVGRSLVNEIVQPVGVEQIGMRAPHHARGAGIIIVGIIVFRHRDGKPLRLIAQVLLFQRAGIVFRMAGDEKLVARFG